MILNEVYSLGLGVPALMECLRNPGRKSGVRGSSHGLSVDHDESVLVDLLVEDGDHDHTGIFGFAGWVVNEEGLGSPGAGLFPSGDLLAVAVIDLQDGSGSSGEHKLSKPVEAILLSLEGGVDDGEVNDIMGRGDNVSELHFLCVHVEIVTTERHFRGDVSTLGVPQEAERLEVEGVFIGDVSSLVGGIDVVGHVVVTSVHHEGVVAGVEFDVGSVTDFHYVEFGVLLSVQFKVLLHGVACHKSGSAHGDGDLGVAEVLSGVSERVVVPQLAVLVGNSSDTDSLVRVVSLDSVEDLLLLHEGLVVHLCNESNSVASSNIVDDVSGSKSGGLEVVLPLVPSLGREVVGRELDEVRRIGGEDHLAVGEFPGHDTDVIALLQRTAPSHGNAGNAIGHSLGSRVREEHVLGLTGGHGLGVEPVVVDDLGAELEGVSVDSVAVVSEESIHKVVEVVLADIKLGRACVNQISLDVAGNASLKLDLNISKSFSQWLGVSGEAVHIVSSHGHVGVRFESLERVGAGDDS